MTITTFKLRLKTESKVHTCNKIFYFRIFRIGMVNVYGSPIDDPEFAAGIKTIIVNENYRPSVTNILLPEPNNVGMYL